MESSWRTCMDPQARRVSSFTGGIGRAMERAAGGTVWMVAKTSGPNCLIVWKMKSWPTAEQIDISAMWLRIAGFAAMYLEGSWKVDGAFTEG